MEVSVHFAKGSCHVPGFIRDQAYLIIGSIFMVWLHLWQISLTLFSAFKSYTCVFIGFSFSNNHVNFIIIEDWTAVALECESYCIVLCLPYVETQ